SAARSSATSRAASTARRTDSRRRRPRRPGNQQMRAQFVFGEVWIGLRRNLTMTIALVVVVAISLCLFGTGLLFFQQVNHTRAFWQGRVQLSVYLCTKA